MGSSKELCVPGDALRDFHGDLYVGNAVAAELVVAHTPDIAILVRHIAAYPAGFSFALVVRSRTEDRSILAAGETLYFNPARRDRRTAEQLYVDVEVDGERIVAPFEGCAADDVHLETLGGSGTGQCLRYECAVRKLPTDGRVYFQAAWTSRQVVNARASIAASRLISAADKARRLWPVSDTAD